MEFKKDYLYKARDEHGGHIVLCIETGNLDSFAGVILLSGTSDYEIGYRSFSWNKRYPWEDLGELKNGEENKEDDV